MIQYRVNDYDILFKGSNLTVIRQNNFRIRIDDIQHSILGYNGYLKNFDKIYK